MPLVFTRANSGRTSLISVILLVVATLVDSFTTALDNTQRQHPRQLDLAGTSPQDAAACATDALRARLYLRRRHAARMSLPRRHHQWRNTAAGPDDGEAAGHFAGKVDAAVPAVTLPLHLPPILVQGTVASTASLVNRRVCRSNGHSPPTPIGKRRSQHQPASAARSSAGAGLGSAIPSPLVATRTSRKSVLSAYTGAIRAMGSANNRWGITRRCCSRLHLIRHLRLYRVQQCRARPARMQRPRWRRYPELLVRLA
jgi:hypothetical protein